MNGDFREQCIASESDAHKQWQWHEDNVAVGKDKNDTKVGQA